MFHDAMSDAIGAYDMQLDAVDIGDFDVVRGL